LTAHAEVRLARRGLRTEWIESAVTEPDWCEPDPKDPEVERRFRTIEEAGGRILRIVCVETETEIRVIAALFDRNARPKL
jgi:uncharacterized DUF497 family protein